MHILQQYTVEYPIALLGGLESGLTVTTINPSGTADEMSQQLANCKPKLIFCSLENCETVKHALSVAQLDKIKIVALRSTPNESYPSNIINFDELIDTNGLMILPNFERMYGNPKAKRFCKGKRILQILCRKICGESNYQLYKQ